MTVAILSILCAIFLIGLDAVYIWYKSRKAWLESKQISLKLVTDQQESINELYERVKVLEQKSNNRARKPRQK